jgi:GTP-binding protein Era
MKSGFIAIVGRSNVGKSTLMNALIGTKIAAVTPKPHTTRHAIQGVLDDERGQIVFVDTPGMFKQAHSKLTGKLTQKIKDSLQGVDGVIYMVDPTREIGDEEKWMMALLKNITLPKILVINKCDLPKREQTYKEWYQDLSSDFTQTIEISALKFKHLRSLVDVLFEVLPEGELIYTDGQKTNVDSNFWIAEVIREKVFLTTEQEVPYTVHVEVDNIEKKPDVIVISARILTTEKHYKGMLIGQNGQKIKEIGQMARQELETSLNKKVFLELEVGVDPHWLEKFE